MLGEAEFLEGALRREMELRGARRHAEGAGANVEVLAVAIEQETETVPPPSQAESSPENSLRRSSIGFAEPEDLPGLFREFPGHATPHPSSPGSATGPGFPPRR